jgi:hypothetical protein
MRIEVAKMRRGYEIGLATGLFRVPRVLEYDEAAGEAKFEWLVGLQGVRRLLANNPTPELVARIGQTLAAIHRDLVLPDDMKKPLPSEFQLPGETEVFLHGDFTVDNVHVAGPGEPIVVLDWQMTDVHGADSTYGSRYFDLTWFINTLFGRPAHRYLGASREAPWATLFLKSYFDAAGGLWEQEELRAYMDRFFTLKFARRRRDWPWLRRLSMIPANARLRNFVRSFRL